MKTDKDPTFILEPVGNDPYSHASRAAMLYYADDIKWHNRELADNIHTWVLDLIKSNKG